MVGAAAGWVEFAFVFCNVGNYELDTMDLNRVVLFNISIPYIH